MVDRGLAESREKARGMIMAGLVEVDGIPIDKPGHPTPTSLPIRIREAPLTYVSRGGLKLEAALKAFPMVIHNKTLIDVGASTGGFTDCLLQHGAARVIALDVGYGQFHYKLRQDPRVRVLERTNARYLRPEDLEEEVDGAVIDVSFISLKLVIPPVSACLKPEAFMIALIKPQFEVGKGLVGKGGVVREPTLHRQVIEEISRFSEGAGWSVIGHIPSPLLGPKGNREFLIALRR
ncbi:MAG: TlyA family RNA methyltransferase [Deltaproteobacteria bacterium]|nr:TlyA family RNA methyltransferase [Deltaproteobacteria bacterium]